MIARLRGEVLEQTTNGVVVDCGGVGYGVTVAIDELQSLRVGTKCDLYIAEQIKEDAHELFGFSKPSRKALFQLLIGVNGVGPKAAMAIMNIGNESQVRGAIANGDTKFISAAVGVGKKVAERIVVDLKNKVGLDVSDDATEFLSDASSQDEAVMALVALGHSTQDAAQMLRGVDANLSVEERIKKALKR